MRIGTLAGALPLTLAMAPLAHALPAPVAISVACSELSTEESAHVEAMLRADLLARAATVSSVKLECQSGWVSAEFEFEAGRVASHGEPKASSPARIAEQLIALSDHLLSVDSGAKREDSNVANLAPSLAALGVSNPVPMSPAAAAPVGADAGAGFVPATSPARRAVLPNGQLRLTGTLQPRALLGTSSTLAALDFEFSGGAEFDAMLPETGGLLGPRVAVAATIRQRFVIEAFGSVSWTLDAPKHYGVRDHRAGLGIEWRGSKQLSIGIAAMLTAIYVSTPAGVGGRSPWSKLEPACQLSLSHGWTWQKFSLELGPILTAYAHPRVVRQDSSNILDLPALLVGIVAQTAYRF